ncbi:MAG: hypothetical protein Q9173_004893, partial [Seirophora scorigena]
MGDAHPLQLRSSKKRRVNGKDLASRYSSPDELAASSDHETPRRTGSHNIRRTSAEHHRRSYEASEPSDSPDELDHTVHTFYRDNWTRPLRPTASRHATPDAPSEISMLTPPEAPGSPITPPIEPPKEARIWSTPTGKHLQTLTGHLAGISTLAWSPDGRTLASGSDDKSIRLWDVVTGKAYPVPLLGHHNYIYSIAFSPKGNMLVSGSYDEAVFLWDVRAARVMRSLPAHADPVGGVDFIRDGTLIVSCAGDGLIRVWDTATGQCLRTLVHEDNAPVSSVRFSPNGKFVLAWTLDSCVRLWNYVEGR